MLPCEVYFPNLLYASRLNLWERVFLARKRKGGQAAFKVMGLLALGAPGVGAGRLHLISLIARTVLPFRKRQEKAPQSWTGGG
jgi:hypothetical protein